MRFPVPSHLRRPQPAGSHAGEASPRAPIAPVAIARRRPVSDLNGPIWRLALSCAALGVLAFAARTVLRPTNPFGVLVTAVPAALAWLTAVRLLLLDARRTRLWRLVLLLTGLTVVPGLGGYGFAVAGGVAFMLFRQGRSYAHLTPVRRAKLFFLALLAAAVSMAAYAQLEQPVWPAHLAQNVARASIDLLRVFWCLTALSLFFGMRLHFLRLKPKLAISALFLVIVPILLLLSMGTVTLYSVVGGTLAARGRTTLGSWLALLDRDPRLGEVLFGSGFHYRTGDVVAGLPAPGAAVNADAGAHTEPPAPAGAAPVPAFVPGLARLLARGAIAADDTTVALADTTALFEADAGLWALRVRGVGGAPVEVWGHRFDAAAMNRLADVLHLDVGFVGGDNVSMRGEDRGGITISLDDSPRHARRRGGRGTTARDSTAGADRNDLEEGSIRLAGRMNASTAPRDSSRALWDRDLYFGASTVGVLEYSGGRLHRDSALLTAKTSLRRLVGEFTSEDNEFNRAVLVLLAVLASVLLVLEAFALFFGIRITSTITSATQALYAGTKRLARGDLATQIDIPNEDEFGDLADAFNEMTAAVRRGREEAVVRELLEREIGTARRIQQRLLPSAMPQLPGFEVVAHSEPSRQVGGDYFDFLPLADGRTGLVIADVSGKGFPAAMLMANLQACLQAQAMHPESIAQILARVNNQLARSTDASMFATLFMGALDAASGQLTGACAGHDPPIICRADGTVDRLRAGGLILGMLPDMRYEQETMQLLPGDVLVLYTDGITEAMGPAVQSDAALPATGADLDADASSPAGAPRKPGRWGKRAQKGKRGRPGEGARPVPGRPPAPGTALVPAAAPDVAAAATAAAADAADATPEITTNFFEEWRLLEVVRAERHRSAAQIRDAILQAVAEHTTGIPQSDDITLIVVKRVASA